MRIERRVNNNIWNQIQRRCRSHLWSQITNTTIRNEVMERVLIKIANKISGQTGFASRIRNNMVMHNENLSYKR